MRLWLRDDENAWKTPEPLQPAWDRVYNGVTPDNQVFPLEPSIRSASEGTAGKKANKAGPPQVTPIIEARA